MDPTPSPPVEVDCRDWAEFYVDAQGERVLRNGDPFLRAERWFNNNVWNQGSIMDFEQCILRREVDGRDEYGWRWPVLRPPDVRGYPEVIYGHKPWPSRCGSQTTIPLPPRASPTKS